MYQMQQYDTPQIRHTGSEATHLESSTHFPTVGGVSRMHSAIIDRGSKYWPNCHIFVPLFSFSPTIHHAAAPTENVPFLLPQRRRTAGALYFAHPIADDFAPHARQELLVPQPPERECLCSRCPSSRMASQAMPGCGHGNGRSVGDVEWLALRGGNCAPARIACPETNSPIWDGGSRANYQATAIKNSILPQNLVSNKQKNGKRKEKKGGVQCTPGGCFHLEYLSSWRGYELIIANIQIL
ncbi:hypothetical protein B0H14DRAFT_2644787, partial [Mycena olivaceomarginata]